jgi:tetratricopeptide (TPR) repeat protein
MLLNLTGCMLPVIKEIADRSGSSPGYNSKNIEKLFEEEEYEKAIEEIDKYLEKRPSALAALNDKAYALIALENNEEAIIVLNDLLKKEVNLDTTLNNLSWAYNNLGLYILADQYADRGLKIKPEDEYLRLNKGNAQYGLENYDEAMSYFDKALEKDSSLTYAVWGKALVYYDKKQYKEALDWFRKYRELGTEDVRDTDYYVTDSLINLKDYDGAISEYKEQIRLNPEEYYTYISLGDAYTMKGDLQQALGSYNKVISVAPEDPEGYYSKSLCLVKLGRKDEACENLESAIQYDSEYLYYAMDDPGFDEIRDYPKFKELFQ